MATNTTAPETISWQKNEGRGTWDIISSCVLTLVLCVWTALHLNVPKQNATLWERFKTKTIWVIVGIFAPEIVVYIAWVQYSSAKYLLRTIQRLGADGADLSKKKGKCGESGEDSEAPSLASTAPSKHKWTMSNCYFAGMGGFAFDSDLDNGGQEFLPGSPSLRFTSHAILLLARLGKLPDVSGAEISDKSKADGLAKTLVCLQATWMLLQSIGRLAAGLPITLLEINTIGHCLCALIIYLIWWNKPLHVLEPTTLSGEWMRGFTSYCYMRSTLHKESMGNISDLWNRKNKTFYQAEEGFRTEMGRLHCVVWENRRGNQDSDVSEPLPHMISISSDNTVTTEPLHGHKIRSDHYTRVFPSNGLILSEGEIIKGLNFTISTSAVDCLSARYHHRNHPDEPFHIERFYPDRRFVVRLTRSDFTRWKLASDFMDSVRGIADTDMLTELKRRDYVATKVSNFPYDGHHYVESNSEGNIVLALTAASAAYGGLHLGSWNSYFQSVIERWLWMSSSIFIAFAGCLPATIIIIVLGQFHISDFFKKQYPKLYEGFRNMRQEFSDLRFVKWVRSSILFTWAKYCIIGAAVVSFLIGSLAYCFARGFIVVEAFISLRRLPLAYYDTPVWSNLIPHL